MSLSKRLSVSSIRSESPLVFAAAPNADAEEWTKTWQTTLARDLIDSPVVSVDAETTVEDACELLLSKDLVCLAINNRPTSVPGGSPFDGLFDFSDVNAFLTLAATRHRWSAEELRENPRIDEIFTAAKAGKVPVHLVSNLSEKNPLVILPHNAAIVSLLSVFSTGTHRVVLRATPPSTDFAGFVSDRSLLSWFTNQAHETSTLHTFLSNSLSSLNLPSLYIYSAVVAAKVVVPSQSNQILSTPLKQFISMIKEPVGSTDGADRYPVYSVLPSSTLLYTMQKLIATDSHRLFVTDESQVQSPYFAPSPTTTLCGIVSIVDILSLFARVANIPDVDPTRMRHRRASSTSTSSSPPSGRSPEHSFLRSRSSSRTSLGRVPAGTNSLRNSVSSLDSFQWAERVPRP
ncbi:unnamed protein product [Somion occarium]|uniref:CBS domain-containing protein n=1 Tax=Somion occarium TaxID=3059160 RepID=A0ABP1CVV5_9APHY